MWVGSAPPFTCSALECYVLDCLGLYEYHPDDTGSCLSLTPPLRRGNMGIRGDELLTAVHAFEVSAHTGETLLPPTLCTASLCTATPWLAAGGGRCKGGLSFFTGYRAWTDISLS